MPRLNLSINARAAVQGAREAKKAVREMQQTVDSADKRIARLEKRLESAGRTSQRTRQRLRRLGTAFAGLAALGAVSGAVRAMGSFEEVMARVRGVAIRQTVALAEQQRQMRSLTSVARELGATTSFTASQAGEGLLFLSRAGFSAEEATAALKSTLDLALVGMIDLGQAADITAATVRQFGLNADEAGKVTDILTLTANRTNTDIVQLAEGMKLAGPIAAALGIDLATTAAALGVLADANLKGTIAGTNLRGVLVGLIDPTKGGTKALNQLTNAERARAGVLRGELLPVLERLAKGQIGATEALAIFNRRSVAGGLVLSENIDKFRALAQANQEVTGEAERASSLIGDTLPKRFKALTSAIEEATHQTGDAGLLGTFKSTTDFLTRGVRALFDYEDGLTAVDKAARAVVIGLGVTGLVGVLTALVTFLGPGAALVAGIGIAAAALLEFSSNANVVTQEVKNLRRELRSLTEGLDDVAASFRIAGRAGDLSGQIRATERRIRLLRRQQTTLEREGAGEGISLDNLRRSGVVVPTADVDDAIRRRLRELTQGLTGRNLALRFVGDRTARLEFEALSTLQRQRARDSELAQSGLLRRTITEPTAEQSRRLLVGPQRAVELFGVEVARRQQHLNNLTKAFDAETAARGETQRLDPTRRKQLEGQQRNVNRLLDAMQRREELVEQRIIRENEERRLREENRRQIKEEIELRANEDLANSILDPIIEGIHSESPRLEDIGRGIIQSISRTAVEELAAKPLQNLLVRFFGTVGFGALASGSQSATAPRLTPGFENFEGGARGMVLRGGQNVVPFARGGAMIRGPVTFPLSNGRTGEAGEFQEEAIFPLKNVRGRLGIEASGLGRSVTITQNITFQGSAPPDFRHTMRQVNQDMRRDLMRSNR